ncbi:hypothetical protein CMT41_10345 [Colwellia sp. MT41]|uniref:hypothetical protein n=1 Tax=Colwellia sp. MT41 TaxID=58049 RepID=UPI0007175EAB|nr:hypothetical protein [Colwellia sp. MT41]ALO35072.1 hypothetical protein CMT41_10345 [Colwellia sp. MT41]
MFIERKLFIIFYFKCILLTSIAFFPAYAVEDEPGHDLDAIDSAARSFDPKNIKTISLSVIENPPVIDGELKDAFWAKSEVLKLTMELYPERFGKAVVDTDVLIGTTSTHVYFAFNAYDPDVSKLRTAIRERDGIKNDDYISVVIDPTGNLRRKYEFRVNPSGSISDILQNTISDRYIYDWDTEWQAAAKITPTGYLVEIAIPIDSLKQPKANINEKNTWMLILKRSYPRNISRTMGGVYIIHPPNIAELQAKQLAEKSDEPFEEFFQQKKTFNLKGYAIRHPNQKRKFGEQFKQVADQDSFNVGFDTSLTIASATKLSITVNPNFTEVEADIIRDSINNPFNVFQPEKRSFFQESMEQYSTLLPLVYTRNLIEPSFGASFSHEGIQASGNVLWVKDLQTTLVMPDNLGSEKVELTDFSNETAAFRYITANKGSAYGVLATSRSGNSYQNTLISTDGLINLGIDDKLRYQLAYSKSNYTTLFAEDLCNDNGCTEIPPEQECLLGECATNTSVLRADANRTLEDHALQIKYKHTGQKTLFWANYFDVGADFRADLGFVKRVDYKLYNIAYGRNWYFQTFKQDEGKSRGRAYLVLSALNSQKGEKIERSADIWAEFRGSYQTVFRPGIRIKERAVNRINQASLALGDNAPLFDERYLQWYFETSPFSPLTVGLDGRVGDIADADNLVLGTMYEFKPRVKFIYQDIQVELSHVYRDYQLDKKMLYLENFSTFIIKHRSSKGTSNRLLIKYDSTKRDTQRFLGNEPAFERDVEIEFTHTRKLTKQLNLLLGAKITKTHNATYDQIYTNQREIYLRLNYVFEKAYF